MNIKYHRINENELNDLPFSEGSMYFCKDSGKLYADPIGGGVHTLINDNINDSGISDTSTWSSSKINENITSIKEELTADYNNKIRSTPPVNLLDNSDFTNPVNQRNVTRDDYFLTNFGYTIDRWRIYGGSDGNVSGIKIVDNGIQISLYSGDSYFDQLVDIDTTITYTFAAKIDNAIEIISGIPNNGSENDIMGLGVNSEGYVRCFFKDYSKVHVIEWAALYEGEYTADTLPEYKPKGYGVELNTCLMFFERLGNAYSVILSNLTHIKFGSTSGIFTINFNKKRIIPTIRFSDLSQYRILYYFNSPNMSMSATSISEITGINATNEMGYFTAKFINDINADCNGLMQRQDNSSSAWIDISADL